MGIDYTVEKDEILQYRFLDDYLLGEVLNSPECVAFWYNYEDTRVSIALYGLNKGIAKLIYMATLPDFQVRGFQSKLQKYAEKTLLSIGINKIVAAVYQDESLISNTFNFEGKKELLEYYKYDKKDVPKEFIIKFKNVKEKLLGEMSPEEFVKKMNKTYDILTEEEIFNSESLKRQYLSHENALAKDEHGLFAVKDSEIKCGIIYEDSDVFDLNIKKVIKIKDVKFLLGPIFATYIVNHENINENEFKVFTDDESLVTVIGNIAGKPDEIANSVYYEKELFTGGLDFDPEDKGNYYSIYEKWNMDEEYPEDKISTFEILESQCFTCKHRKPGNFDSCKKYEEIPWEILVADESCDKYIKKN